MQDIIRRAVSLVRSWPWLLLIPLAAEFIQHVVEIRIGMYAGNRLAPNSGLRLAFGALKVLAILVTLIVAWRLWRFNGNKARALRPTRLLFKGIALVLLVQMAGDLAALGIGKALTALAPAPSRPERIAFVLIPLLLWLLASVTLFPWYVGLATEDRDMTLQRSIRASRARLPTTWGLFAVGFLPLMIVHYALGYAAMKGGPTWPLMIVDAVVVVGLTASLAATYYVIYERTRAQGMRPTD